MQSPVTLYPIIMQVIELISQGRTKTWACDRYKLSVAVYNRTVREDTFLSEFAEEATQRGHDALADILLEIDSNPMYGSSDPKMATVISKNIQWFLSRRDKRYNERTVVTHEITADRVITDALTRAKDRATTSAVLENVPYTDVTPVLADDDAAEREALLALY